MVFRLEHLINQSHSAFAMPTRVISLRRDQAQQRRPIRWCLRQDIIAFVDTAQSHLAPISNAPAFLILIGHPKIAAGRELSAILPPRMR